MQVSCRKKKNIIARTHAHTEIAHFPMRCIIRALEAQGHRPSGFLVLMMHQGEKCTISAWERVLAFIP